VASTTQQIGGAVGLAVLVAVANTDTHGLTGPALRAATASGLRDAMAVAAAGIALTAVAALGFTPTRRQTSTSPAPSAPEMTLEKTK
jgi:hypothetical protein